MANSVLFIVVSNGCYKKVFAEKRYNCLSCIAHDD